MPKLMCVGIRWLGWKRYVGKGRSKKVCEDVFDVHLMWTADLGQFVCLQNCNYLKNKDLCKIYD